MRLTITLDDVIRAKTKQIGKIYKKHIDPSIELETLDFSSDNFVNVFGFEDEESYKTFLYTDYSYEIFAEASTTDKMIDKELYLWHIRQIQGKDYDEPLELSLSNPFEYNQSIGYTCFFLAKIATRIRNFFFPEKSIEIWDRSDVVITATPALLKNKPEGKIAIKIETDYNKDLEADYTYKSLKEFLDDETIMEKLMNKE